MEARKGGEERREREEMEEGVKRKGRGEEEG